MKDQETYWRIKNAYLGLTSDIEAAFIAKDAQRWQDTRDRGHLDSAIAFCAQRNLPILPDLAKMLASEVEMRRGGTLSRAQKEGARLEALVVMANFVILADATLARAAGAAAVLSAKSPHPMKASSLEKTYADEFRSGEPNMEDQARCRLEAMDDFKEKRRLWRDKLARIPEPTDDQLGYRR